MTACLPNHRHLRLPANRHLFAPTRKSVRARAEAASRIGLAAPAGNGEARLCGARRQRVSRHGQGEHPRPADETATTDTCVRTCVLGAFANGQRLQEDAGLQHLLCGTGRSGRI
jgi:hypothetical protein